MIKVKKGDKTATFAPMAWALMGKNNNSQGWVEVGSANDTAPPNVTKDINTEKDYKAALNRANGFAKDGKYEDALKQFEAAAALKSTSHVKGKITAMKNAIATEKKYNETVAIAEKFVEDGNHESAIEMYETAKLLTKDKTKLASLDEVIAATKAAEEAKGDQNEGAKTEGEDDMM